jgi:hypothetical protein
MEKLWGTSIFFSLHIRWRSTHKKRDVRNTLSWLVGLPSISDYLLRSPVVDFGNNTDMHMHGRL